jgi:hypothetical protein
MPKKSIVIIHRKYTRDAPSDKKIRKKMKERKTERNQRETEIWGSFW